MSQQKSIFGTDGIRGQLGEGLINPQGMMKVGWALGKSLKGNLEHAGNIVVCLGRDSRASGYCLQSALISGLNASGVSVEILGMVPTPLVAFHTSSTQAAAGVMITASHNSAADNGLKIFGSTGEKIDEKSRNMLVQYLKEPVQIQGHGKNFGSHWNVGEEAQEAYLAHIARSVNKKLSLFRDKRVVIDPGYGAMTKIAEQAFLNLGCDVAMIHHEINGYNINENSGSTYPEALQEYMRNNDADIGVSFDGDGDRVILVDRDLRILDGDDFLYLFVQANRNVKKVVTTTMVNKGLLSAFEKMGVEVVQSKVGDIHVNSAIKMHNAKVGAEPNGHMIISDYNQSGDGLLAAVVIIAGMLDTQMHINDAGDSWERFPQRLINFFYKSEQECVKIKEKIESVLSEFDWVDSNIRISGTESCLRLNLQAAPQGAMLIVRIEQRLLEECKALGWSG